MALGLIFSAKKIGFRMAESWTLYCSSGNQCYRLPYWGNGYESYGDIQDRQPDNTKPMMLINLKRRGIAKKYLYHRTQTNYAADNFFVHFQL